MGHKTKDERREEATARNDAWAALHYTEKLERLHRRRGFSQRQRARIMAPLTAKKAKIAAEPSWSSPTGSPRGPRA